MEIVVVGCRAGVPTDGWPSSGYLVEAGGRRILLDCGPGVATALGSYGGPSTVDAIVLSHLHPDHCHDLLPVGTALRRQATAVHLYGPVGTAAVLHRLARVYPFGPDPAEASAFATGFTLHEYTPGDVVDLDGCTVRTVGLRHVVPNCGVRIHDGTATMAYTGDTGVTDALLELARGVDLLLAEATRAEPEQEDYGHLCAVEAAQVAADAGVGQLVLTHFGSTDPDWLRARRLEAEKVFPGPVHLATPNARFRVGS